MKIYHSKESKESTRDPIWKHGGGTCSSMGGHHINDIFICEEFWKQVIKKETTFTLLRENLFVLGSAEGWDYRQCSNKTEDKSENV